MNGATDRKAVDMMKITGYINTAEKD
jgi:hypothetical protein